MSINTTQLATVISTYQAELLEGWMTNLFSRLARRDKSSEGELRLQASQFLVLIAGTLNKNPSIDIQNSSWDDARQVLAEISQSRARQGFTPIETASFVFSLKEPLFAYLRTALADKPAQLSEE